MPNLNDLAPNELSAAMRGGTEAWGEIGSSERHVRYALPQLPKKRRKCSCGCGQRAIHRGLANGMCLTDGCELRIRRWVRDGK